MSGDLIERLLQPLPEGMCGRSMGCNAASICLCSVIEDQREALSEAADVIARLVGALEPFALEADNHDRPDIKDDYGFAGDIYFGDLRRARQTLTDTAAQRQSVSPQGDGGLAQ